MKKIILGAVVCLSLFACSDNKTEEKSLLDSVIKMHDSMMGKDDKLMNNKMKVDTLLKAQLTGDTASAKRELMGLKVQLTNAEDAMETWMQKFDPEQKGKTHQEKMDYLHTQKSQVMGVDSMMGAAINASSHFIDSLKNK